MIDHTDPRFVADEADFVRQLAGTGPMHDNEVIQAHGKWCDAPERKLGQRAMGFDTRCRECMIATYASLVHEPETSLGWRPNELSKAIVAHILEEDHGIKV